MALAADVRAGEPISKVETGLRKAMSALGVLGNSGLPNRDEPIEIMRANVDIVGPVKLVPFKLGARVCEDRPRYVWPKIPEGFDGFFFTQFDHHSGVTEFEVRTDGRIG